MNARGLRILVAASLALGLSSTPFVARGDSDDPAAIAKFLSIGFANAHDGFMALRGQRLTDEIYRASEWPDHTHFITCLVLFSKTLSAYVYACTSTARSESFNALFNMASDAVQANLPGGYTSGPVDQGGGSGAVSQMWSRAGYPYVLLTEKTNGADDQPEYTIAITASPASN